MERGSIVTTKNIIAIIVIAINFLFVLFLLPIAKDIRIAIWDFGIIPLCIELSGFVIFGIFTGRICNCETGCIEEETLIEDV